VGGTGGFANGSGMKVVTTVGEELDPGAEATGCGFGDVNQPWLTPTATAPNSRASNSQSGAPARRSSDRRQLGLGARPRRRGPIGKIDARVDPRPEERFLLPAPRLLRRRAVMPECLSLS
ncbi:MAG: hypothetical protein ACREFM_23095, partial [Hypericibacter sp.]